MENLLPKRAKNLTGRTALLCTGILVLAAAVYLLFFHPPGLDRTSTEKILLPHLQSIDGHLENKVTRYRLRARTVFRHYKKQTLKHPRLKNKEALLITRDNRIVDYYGEIFYYRPVSLDTGRWTFIEKKDQLYFLYRLSKHVFYTRLFFDLRENLVFRYLKFDVAVKELKFLKPPASQSAASTFHYDEGRELYSSTYLFKNSNYRLNLFLQFSREDIARYYRKRADFYLFGAAFLFLFFLTAYFFRRRRGISLAPWLTLLTLLFVMVTRWGGGGFFLQVNSRFTFTSMYQVFILLVAGISLIYWLRDKIKLKIVSLLLFNLTFPACLYLSHLLFGAVQFNYTRLGLNSVLLVLMNFLLHLLPMFWIRRVFLEARWKTAGGVALLQVAVIVAGSRVEGILLTNLVVLSVIGLIMLFFNRKFPVRALILLLVAFSIFILNDTHGRREKKEFVQHSLKNIFLNQTNYAKFITREILYQLNRENEKFSVFPTLFTTPSSSRLKTIWQKTLASRENIPSGIFIVSPEGEVMSSYAYQMEYLEIHPRMQFPFWVVIDADARLYGRKISLGVAYTNVLHQSKLLGRIIVQVMNSPELILRHQDKINIFTIDNKINGKDVSYIKLDEHNQIMENPSNINLENVSDILEKTGQWTTFRFIDVVFNGYVFKHQKHTVIIFFPTNTVFKQLSEIIKIFLFLMLLFLLFYSRDLRRVDWKGFYYSFSIRVFFILILVSLFTAVIFSIFSLNVNSQSSLRQARQMIYERGLTAQNIGYNQLTEDDEFTPHHLLLLSRILNADVSVYKGGVLQDTSNYRKILNNQLPKYLHSNIIQRLDRKNQKFVLSGDEGGFHFYFKIYNYILEVEFAYGWRKILSEESYYTNFIITLFFILVLIGLSAAFFFRNKIIAPIDALNSGMAEVRKGNLQPLEKIPSEIEIKSLYTGFNNMLEGIREQRKNISEISRMKTMIKLGRRVAHEVKNPLTPIKLSAEQILRALMDKNPNYEQIIRQSVNYIIDETNHLKKVSYGFLDLSRMDELTIREFDFKDLLREELFHYRQIYSFIDFPLGDDIARGSLPVHMDKIKIKQVLKNLINNSIDAIGEKKGHIEVTIQAAGGRVMLAVEDDGAGMPENALDQAYDADYSTKEAGTGLGLFIVRRIVELHKGKIRIESHLEEGTRVLLDLPRDCG